MTTVARYEQIRDAVRGVQRATAPPKGLDAAAAWVQLRLRTRPVSARFLWREAGRIEREAKRLEDLDDGALADHVGRLAGRLARGDRNRLLVCEALAVSHAQAARIIGQRPYRVQLMGALGLWHGRFIEMGTGEGKSLTAALVAPLLAWRWGRAHVITVNDYLAGRDASAFGPLFSAWGLTSGAVDGSMSPEQRRIAYGKQVVYGTAKQVTGDWLHDAVQLAGRDSAWAALRDAGRSVLGVGRRAVIVDEADAVLIDDAVSPLIISEAGGEEALAAVFRQADRIASKLDDWADFRVKPDQRRATLTRRGEHRAGQLVQALEHPVWRGERRARELVERALEARRCFQRGRHYEVVEGRVVLVDEQTGRLLPDRSWQHGVHQAVEAKEEVAITADRTALAQVSFQRFFRGYPFLCGMTGTAAESAGEMERVYGRAVVRVPAHRPVRRARWRSKLFQDEATKLTALVEEAMDVRRRGRPVLIGTRSIDTSERIASMLRERGAVCEVLHALRHEAEAQIIASAGQASVVTVATNMAGRGTDITLDEQARDAGGLHVMLAEPNLAARVDRQFLGRAGRQGDPGSGRVYVSLEDDLIEKHGGAWAWLGARGIVGLAQRRAERQGRRLRREVLRQDDWADRYLPRGAS